LSLDSRVLGFGCLGVVFLFIDFPLRQQISCLFYFPHLRYFAAHEHTLGCLEVIIYFSLGSQVVVEEIVHELSLEDPSEESYALFEFNLDMVCEKAEALLDSTPKIRPENGETTEILSGNTYSLAAEVEEKDEHLESIEHLEQIEPLSAPNLFDDKDVSIEAHSFITIPFVTLHEPQALILQCLKEPSYAKSLKDLCTQALKSKNRRPQKIL
jgi:hypothetical protein